MEDRWADCWGACREIQTLLAESDTLEGAREKVINFLHAVDWTFRRDLDSVRSWNYILLREAGRCLTNIVSPRNERLAGNSSLEKLWQAARNGDAEVSQDFIDEFTHLFKALKGQSDVYPSRLAEGIEQPDYDTLKGREAAIERSNFLEALAGRHGQEESVIHCVVE